MQNGNTFIDSDGLAQKMDVTEESQILVPELEPFVKVFSVEAR
jgi:hypothetical protein